MIDTATPQQPRRAETRPAPCALDRHFGPFLELPELQGWLGADWCTCGSCRSTITLATAASQRIAA